MVVEIVITLDAAGRLVEYEVPNGAALNIERMTPEESETICGPQIGS